MRVLRGAFLLSSSHFPLQVRAAVCGETPCPGARGASFAYILQRDTEIGVAASGERFGELTAFSAAAGAGKCLGVRRDAGES